MPTFDASFNDFEKLVGVKLPKNKEKLWKKLLSVKTEIEELNLKKDIIKFEPADSNRPDMWHVEGLARALKGAMGLEKGIPKYKIKQSNNKVIVKKNVKKIRPFIACASVKKIEFDDFLIKQLMQLQLKIDGSYGRKRKKSSIGIYNLDLISFPITYKAVKKDEASFIPLGFEKKMTPQEILNEHPKGIEYGKILSEKKKVPILIDSNKKILSMPPIINSNDVGKITTDTKNVFIEVTGENYDAVIGTLNFVITALADRGGLIESVQINYGKKTIITPDVSCKKITVKKESIIKNLGMQWSDSQLKELFLKARFDVLKISSKNIELKIPFYRTDIMHEFDAIEDLAVIYGFENIESESLELSTKGELLPESLLNNKIRDLIIGMGFLEILNYNRCDKEILFNKECIEIENPIGITMNVLRNELLPITLNWLSKNTHYEYPQNVFELGKIFLKKKNEIIEQYHVSIVSAHSQADFTQIKQLTQWILNNLSIKYELKEYEHEAFIKGRCAGIYSKNKLIGYFGEIKPKTIIDFKMETPICAMELII